MAMPARLVLRHQVSARPVTSRKSGTPLARKRRVVRVQLNVMHAYDVKRVRHASNSRVRAFKTSFRRGHPRPGFRAVRS